jgi:hypothetical protein
LASNKSRLLSTVYTAAIESHVKAIDALYINIGVRRSASVGEVEEYQDLIRKYAASHWHL